MIKRKIPDNQKHDGDPADDKGYRHTKIIFGLGVFFFKQPEYKPEIEYSKCDKRHKNNGIIPNSMVKFQAQ